MTGLQERITGPGAASIGDGLRGIAANPAERRILGGILGILGILALARGEAAVLLVIYAVPDLHVSADVSVLRNGQALGALIAAS